MKAAIERGYENIRKLAFGGEGQVFLCQKDGETLLMKIVPRMESSRLDIFEQMRQLESEYLPKFKEIFSDAKKTYMIREYIDGNTLEDEIKASGRLSYQRSKEIMLALCRALKAFHGAKPAPIIHRDIKPGNIIVNSGGGIKLIDFGIARSYKKEAQRDTVLAGTRGYSAPEVMAGMQSDARSDIYSLGLIFYEMLSGKSLLDPPYQIRPLAESVDSLPHGLDKIIKKATDVNQIFRYATADALAADIQRAGNVKRKACKAAAITAAAAIFAAVALLLVPPQKGVNETSGEVSGKPAAALLEAGAHGPAFAQGGNSAVDYTGQHIDDVCSRLSREGILPLVYSAVSGEYERGRIISWAQDGGGFVFTVSAGPPVENVIFEDKALEKAVKKYLGIDENAYISSLQMESLTAIDDIQGLTSLSGLEYAVNLDTLSFNSSSISDITPIKNLGKIEQLRMYTSEITDISCVARLRNLKLLNADENHIADISALKGLDLIDLSLGHNDITDISPLESSDNLAFLSIRSNAVSDISVISDCMNLSVLWADCNEFSDIKPLSGLDSLMEIEMNNNYIYDLAPLTQLDSLKYINLCNINARDYSPLLECPSLKKVNLGPQGNVEQYIVDALEAKGVTVTVQ